jgi:TatD DNase family protein
MVVADEVGGSGPERPKKPAYHLRVLRQPVAGLGSVNVAMTNEMISKIPQDRLLPETDFPATRRFGVDRPGEIDETEKRVSQLWRLSQDEVRIHWYRNLTALVTQAGLFERVPDDLADLLLST